MAHIIDTVAGLDLIRYNDDDLYEYAVSNVSLIETAMTWGKFREYLRTTDDVVATVTTPRGDMEIWSIELVTEGFDDITVVAVGAPTEIMMIDRVDPRSVLSEAGVEVLHGPKRPTVLAHDLDALFDAAHYDERLGDLRNTTVSIDYKGAAHDTNRANELAEHTGCAEWVR